MLLPACLACRCRCCSPCSGGLPHLLVHTFTHVQACLPCPPLPCLQRLTELRDRLFCVADTNAAAMEREVRRHHRPAALCRVAKGVLCVGPPTAPVACPRHHLPARCLLHPLAAGECQPAARGAAAAGHQQAGGLLLCRGWVAWVEGEWCRRCGGKAAATHCNTSQCNTNASQYNMIQHKHALLPYLYSHCRHLLQRPAAAGSGRLLGAGAAVQQVRYKPSGTMAPQACRQVHVAVYLHLHLRCATCTHHFTPLGLVAYPQGSRRSGAAAPDAWQHAYRYPNHRQGGHGSTATSTLLLHEKQPAAVQLPPAAVSPGPPAGC